MKKSLILGLFASLLPLIGQAQIDWQPIEPGVWKGVVGTPEKYSLLSVAECSPLKEGLLRLPNADIPPISDKITGNIQDGKTALCFPLEKEEQIYGFGLNFKTVHQRGRILELHVDD